MKEIHDPSASTHSAIGRASFLGLSGGALAASAEIGRAMAQDLGKPHAPIVPEDDPAIVAEAITIQLPDIAMPGYSARPSQLHSGTAGLVVIMHIWGVDVSIRDVVRRYAKAGYTVVAPDLYARFHAPSGDGISDINVFRPFGKQLNRSQYSPDIAAAARWLAESRGESKIGITGFCMGGHIVLEQTIDNAKLFAAAAPFYGPVKGIDPQSVRVPICGSYGQRDTSIPADDVRAFAAALTVPNDIKIYPEAGHAFFDDQRGAYVPSAAADAWTRTTAFFEKYLQGG